MFSVKDLSLYSIDNKLILSTITGSITSGTITVLLGPSGSGKTTLLRCIAGLEKTYKGTITLENRELRMLSGKERSRNIGFVFQQGVLFPHLTVLENCTQALRVIKKLARDQAEERAYQALLALDMDPERYGDVYPAQLSGGQQQRVALARALVMEPKLLLLDEPTSALDPATTSLFVELLKKCNKDQGTTVLVATHDKYFVQELFPDLKENGLNNQNSTLWWLEQGTLPNSTIQRENSKRFLL